MQCQLVLLMPLCMLACETMISMMAISVHESLSTKSAGVAHAVVHAQVCKSKHLEVNSSA